MQLFIVSVSLVLFVAYAALILYYAFSWRQIPFFPGPTNHSLLMPDDTQPTILSIIIPARNEEKNIAACLDSICNQSYPTHLYEIIVVDDHSTDNTAAIVKKYAAQNVKLISLKEVIQGNIINSYKKKAIEAAVAQAAGELIITTDADCVVQSHWLQTIDAFYKQTNAAFIAMPVSVECSKSFIEMFQALDFMTLQGITGASVYKHIHSMCNGANLAYTKEVFKQVNGFAGIDNIASGDDMLLMHKIYKEHPGKVFFLKSKEVIVQTAPVTTVKDFFNQRIRWASKADKYDDKRIFAVLLLVYLFNVALIILPVTAVFNMQYAIPVAFGANVQISLFSFWLALLAAKTFVEVIFIFPVARFFNKQTLLWLFPFFQPFHIAYTVIAGWLGKFGSYQWKERKVN